LPALVNLAEVCLCKLFCIMRMISAAVIGAALGGSSGVRMVKKRGDNKEKEPQPEPEPEREQPGDPQWGCGVIGNLPGTSKDGECTSDLQKLLDVLKASSSDGKVTFWNQGLNPTEGQYLSTDMTFVPEMWASAAFFQDYLMRGGERTLGVYTNAKLLIGWFKPDQAGFCRGNSSCHDVSCCWGDGVPSAAGFLPFTGCSKAKPLPSLWEDGEGECIDSVANTWAYHAGQGYEKGYEYLATPHVVYVSWAEKFIERVCRNCTSASCGCPTHVSISFYASDCRPESLGSYDGFRGQLAHVGRLMEKYSFIKGALVSEVAMANCPSTKQNPGCAYDSGNFPASQLKNGACPISEDLPEGMASYIKKMVRIAAAAKTDNGRAVVKGFDWFHVSAATSGYTIYNQELLNNSGQLTDNGRAYMEACSEWKSSS